MSSTHSLSIIDNRIALLKVQAERLLELVNNPHPGLRAWMEAVPRVTDEIDAIMAGKRDVD
jgi:hypothetical protein